MCACTCVLMCYMYYVGMYAYVYIIDNTILLELEVPMFIPIVTCTVRFIKKVTIISFSVFRLTDKR